jgi:hypothetical protein
MIIKKNIVIVQIGLDFHAFSYNGEIIGLRTDFQTTEKT